MTRPESHRSPEGGLGPCKTTNMLSDNLPHNITLATLARQRIAVCMVGAARTLVLPAVHSSIRANLLDAQMVPVDLFVDISLDSGVRSDSPHLQRALQMLRPTRVRLRPTSGCEAPQLHNHGICTGKQQLMTQPDQKTLGGFFQYMWVVRCLRSAFRHEQANGLSYSWIIRTRPDVAFFDRVPPCVVMSRRRLVLMAKESNPAFFDGFWMSPRWLATVLADGIEHFWGSASVLPWPPEHSVFPFLQARRRVAWAYALVPGLIVRRAKGRPDDGECWRLRRKETPESVYDVQGTMWGREPVSEPRMGSADGAHDGANAGASSGLLTFADACERWVARALHNTTVAASVARGGTPDAGGDTTPTCGGWVQTISCDPAGAQDTLTPRRGCHTTIQKGWSGYCECRKPQPSRPAGPTTRTSAVGCGHPIFTCAAKCSHVQVGGGTGGRRAAPGARLERRLPVPPIATRRGMLTHMSI